MNVKAIIFILCIFLSLPAGSFASELGALRISLIEGDAQLLMAESSEWVPLAINTPLREGDRIWVPEDGRLEINLRDGTFVRLDENSSLEILAANRDSFQFFINRGHAYINFRGIRDGVMQIDTPVSSLRSFERVKFMIDVDRRGRTEVAVIKGIVYAESRGGRTTVNAGRVLDIRDDGDGELHALGPADAWERWNHDRDSRYEDRSYASTQYLPAELDSFAYDFDDNGRWVYVKEYGHVWTPTVYVSAGWSPYRHGRWIWAGNDYVWISYEPWGWAPYHYGRWAFVSAVGWCWVPPARGAVYWGPGYVGWVHTPTYVAWVPLAPGDTYYGYGYYGPYSVNILSVQKTSIRHDYRNSRHRDSVVVLHNDTFRTGRHVEFQTKENPFLRKGGTFGRPTFAAETGLRMPVMKEISPAKQPPSQLRNIQINELKRERPLVKEKHMAVISSDAVQKSMPLREVQEPRKREYKSSVGAADTQRQPLVMQQEKTEAVRQPEGLRELRTKTPDSRKETPSEPAARVHEPSKTPVERPSDRSKASSEKKMVTPGEPAPPPSSLPFREMKKRPDSEAVAPAQIPRKSSGQAKPEQTPKAREAAPQPRWPSALPESVAPQPPRSEKRESPAPAQSRVKEPAPASKAQQPAAEKEKPRKETPEAKPVEAPPGSGGLRPTGAGK